MTVRKSPTLNPKLIVVMVLICTYWNGQCQKMGIFAFKVPIFESVAQLGMGVEAFYQSHLTPGSIL